MRRTVTTNLQPARVSPPPSEPKLASTPKASGPTMQSGAETPDVFSPAMRAGLADATRTSRAAQKITAAERSAKLAEMRQFLQGLDAHSELREWLAVNKRWLKIDDLLSMTGAGVVRTFVWELHEFGGRFVGDRRVTFGVPIPFRSVRLSEEQLTHIDLPTVQARLAALLKVILQP